MTIFASDTYREAIRSLLDREALRGRRVTLSLLADACRVQRPYISKVMAGAAHLSADQMFELAFFFKLGDDEQKYLFLLLEHERSGLDLRRKSLKVQIDTIRARYLAMARHTSAELVRTDVQATQGYYLDPTVQLAHVFLGLKRYGVDLPLLAHDLQISSERLAAILALLAGLGLIAGKRGRWQITKQHVHLSANESLCLPHQLLLRMRCLERLQKLPAERTFLVSKTFTGAKRLDLKIRDRLLTVLREIEADIAPSPEEEAFQLNIDLFPWTS